MSLILSGTDGLSDVDGTAATPAIRGTDANTGIFFPAADTIAFAEGGAEVARFDSSGNFGVGTASPAAKVNIGSGGAIRFNRSDNATYGEIFYGGSTVGMKYVDYNNDGHRFFNISTQVVTIDTSGNLLVGTTSAGGTGTTIYKAASVNAGAPGSIHFNGSSAATETVMSFQYNGSAVGSITRSTTATAYVTSSDYRLKNSITPMIGALAKVSALKPCTYKWNVDGSDGEGFIAHELAEVCPHAVTGEKDAVDADGNPQYQGIDTSFLVATLTAAIQEQQSFITQLTARITALESA